jgi:DNA invertase Pin-like site-specific DNA recombinase
MPVKARRTAIYARISTDETRQNPETQLLQLREYATLCGFEIVGEYIDYASGR